MRNLKEKLRPDTQDSVANSFKCIVIYRTLIVAFTLTIKQYPGKSRFISSQAEWHIIYPKLCTIPIINNRVLRLTLFCYVVL